MTTSCKRSRSQLSAYLDGAMTGAQMQALSQHLAGCGECSRQFTLLRQTQSAVAGLGRKPAPRELALQIRLALSREAARATSWRWQSLRVRFENLMQAFMVPATAGAFTAIVLFGMVLGFFGLPQQLRASNDVAVPITFYTPAEVSDMPWRLAESADAGVITLEVMIDQSGRVNDYRILSDSDSDNQDLPPDLKNLLVFAQFHPATAFGRPTTGRVVLSFTRINVKG
jgi:predicted anti-sigma-YlaC factor YlaD